MATESFLKNITIKEVSETRRLINALENAHKKSAKNVTLSRTVHKLDRKQIKDFFGDL